MKPSDEAARVEPTTTALGNETLPARDVQREQTVLPTIYEVLDALEDCFGWMICDCGHPACKRCPATKTVRDILDRYYNLRVEQIASSESKPAPSMREKKESLDSL